MSIASKLFWIASYSWGFPGGTSDKEPACQCRGCKRHGFDPWVGKIPWRIPQMGCPASYSPLGRKESDTSEWLNWTEAQLLYPFIWQYLGFFHVLAIADSAAVNIGVRVSFWVMVSLGYMHSSGIAGSYGSFIPNFFKKSLYYSP